MNSDDMISRGELLELVTQLGEQTHVDGVDLIVIGEKDDGRQGVLKTVLRLFDKLDFDDNDLLDKQEALRFFRRLLTCVIKKIRRQAQ